jgi:DNA-binding MarR family transcriptional regulator
LSIETTRYTTPTDEAATSLQGQTRRLVAAWDAVFRRLTAGRPWPMGEEASLSLQDARAFGALAHLGATSMSEFARALGVPLSTATHSVDRLVKRALVAREHSERDRRIVKLRLTERGSRIAKEFLEHRLALITAMLAPLSVGEREIFLELVDKIARFQEEP